MEFIDIWRWTVEAEDVGTRLDHFVRDQDVGPTRSQIKKLIEAGLVSVDDATARAAQKLKVGQLIVMRVPPPQPLSAEPEPMDLDVRFEDDQLLVVNKPQGLVVHPAPGHPRGTLVNGVIWGRTTVGGDALRPGIVHRLDKDTSGLMVIAKTERCHAHLAAQFHEHSVDRRYAVLVMGRPPARGEWRTLHGRHPKDRKRFSSRVSRGKNAVSLFQLAEELGPASLLKVELKTGRTHQVRVHCYDHGFPVLGDPMYTPKHLPPFLAAIHRDLPGQALHAELLGFEHPVSGERLSFFADPPEAFAQALSRLREESSS